MHRALVPQSIAAVLLLLSSLRPRGRKKEIKLPLCFSLSVARIEKETEKKKKNLSCWAPPVSLRCADWRGSVPGTDANPPCQVGGITGAAIAFDG